MGEYSFLILIGFVVLIAGGELLVRGAGGLARAMRIPPLIVGLTVVAFCTSAPELAVSVRSAVQGETQLAVGNVVGSCICNILLVLGLAALVRPLTVNAKLIRWESPLLIGITGLFWWFCRDGELNAGHGLVLVAGLLAYMVWSILTARKENAAIQAQLARDGDASPPTGLARIVFYVFLLLFGLGMLLLGSNWLIQGAVGVAELLQVSQLVIGLTVLALGTSLPELAISIIAALRGHRDLAVGNVIGSNIFNILGVLGVTAMAAPGGLPVSLDALHFDIPVMVGVSIVCLPVFFTGHEIDRVEAILLLLFYAAYIVCLAIGAVSPAWGSLLKVVVFGIGGPMVILYAFYVALAANADRRDAALAKKQGKRKKR